MAKTDHWMPLYIGDYLADTSHMDRGEHGAYLLLLMHYWRKGPLPSNPRYLAGVAKMTMEDWTGDAGQTVASFFTLGADGLLHQKRMDAEIAKKERVSAVKRQAGRAGVEARRRQSGSGCPAHADGLTDISTTTATAAATEEQKPPRSVVGHAHDARATRLPEDWTPSQDDLEYARSHGFSDAKIEIMATKFKNHWLEKGGQAGRKVGWHRTWQNWVLEEVERTPASQRGSLALPLLRPIDGGKASDPNDAWGVDEWCRSINAEAITDATHLKHGKWMHKGCIIDGIARDVAEAAGFPSTWRGDWSLLLQWLDAGCVPSQHIYPAVRAAAEYFRKRGDPAASLAAFDRSVHKRRAA